MADNHFLEGFLKSLGMISASEIGDKTFFIAAIMAMKHPRLTVRMDLILTIFTSCMMYTLNAGLH